MTSKLRGLFNRSREIHGQATDDGETALTKELNRQLQDKLDHEQEKAQNLEGQLQLTQDKLHREQQRAHHLEVDYQKEVKELRESRVTINVLEEDQTKLKRELASLKDTCQRQKAELQQFKGQLDDLVGQLQQAKDQLHVEQERARHLEDDKLMIKRNWTEAEARVVLENEALQQQRDSAVSKYNKLERKYIQLNKENERLSRPAGKPDNEHFQQPATFTTDTNQQCFVRNDHQCWLESANKLLQNYDDLSKEMAENLSNTCIKGSRSNWKSLCEVLDVNYENLQHVHPTERMLNIVKQYQQQNEEEVTVRIIYDALKSISAKRAASLLLKRTMKVHEQRKRTASESQMHSGRRSQPIQTSYSMSYASRTQMVTGEDDLSFSREHYNVTTVAVTNSSLGDEAISLNSTESPQDV